MEKSIKVPLTDEEHRHVKALAVLRGEDMGKMAREWVLERYGVEREKITYPVGGGGASLVADGPRSG